MHPRPKQAVERDRANEAIQAKPKLSITNLEADWRAVLPRVDGAPQRRTVAMLVAATVMLSHGALLWMFTGEHPNSFCPISSVDSLMLIIPPEKPSRAAEVPLPELHWVAPTVDSTAIIAVSFVDPDSDIVKDITAPASAPQLDPAVTVDSIPYALRAGLRTGGAVTIVLGIEVLADGSTGQVTILSSSGRPVVDAAGVEYARALRWIPATVQRRARAMRINFAVTLALPG